MESGAFRAAHEIARSPGEITPTGRLTVRTKLCGFMAVTTLAIGLLALPVISAAQNVEKESNLDELLRQRRDTLQRLVEVVTEEYHSGKKTFGAVVQAKDRLIDAELELVNGRQDRLALLRQQVEMFEALSTVTDERFALGQVTQSERLAARAAVLDAKIELVWEQDRIGEGTADERASD